MYSAAPRNYESVTYFDVTALNYMLLIGFEILNLGLLNLL